MNRADIAGSGGSQRITPFAGVLGLAIVVGLLLGQLLYHESLLIGIIVAGALVAIVYVRLDPWRGLMLLIIASQFSGLRFNVGQFTIRPDQLVFLFILVSWLLLFMYRRVRLHSSVLDIPIVGLITVGFISSYLYSNDPSFSYRSLALQVVYMAMFYLTVTILLDNRDKIDTAVKAIMVIAMLHAFYGVMSLAGNTVGINLGGISFSHSATLSIPSTAGFFPEANLLGAFATIMLALFLAHLVPQEKTGIMAPKYLVIGTVLLLSILITSLTRSAWVGMVFIVAAMLFYAKPRWNIINPRAVKIFFIVILGTLAIAFPVVNLVFSSASGRDNALFDRVVNIVNLDSSSFEGRADAQELALERWQEKPVIGYGVLSMDVGTLANRGWLFSTMVQSLHDTGLVGGFFMLWIHAVPVIYGLRAAARTNDRLRRASLIGLSLGAVAMFISSQLSSFIWLGFPWIFLGILVAAAKDTMEYTDPVRASLAPAGAAGLREDI